MHIARGPFFWPCKGAGKRHVCGCGCGCGCMDTWIKWVRVELETKAPPRVFGPKGYELHVLVSAACTACHSALFLQWSGIVHCHCSIRSSSALKILCQKLRQLVRLRCPFRFVFRDDSSSHGRSCKPCTTYSVRLSIFFLASVSDCRTKAPTESPNRQ